MKVRVLAIALLWVFGPLPTYACPNTNVAAASRGCVDLAPAPGPAAEAGDVPLPRASRFAAVRSRDCVEGFCAEPGMQPGRAGKSVKVQTIAPDGRVIADTTQRH